MGLQDLLTEFSDQDLQDIAVEVREGEVSDDILDSLAAEFEALDDDRVGAAVEERPPLADVLFELGLEVPPPPQEPVEIEEEIEVEEVGVENRIRTLLELAPGRSTAYYLEWVAALEQGDATGIGISQDDMDSLTDSQRENLQRLAEQRLQTVRDFDPEDFPDINRLTERGPGRSVGYFRRVLEELQGERDPETLPEEELQQLIDVAPDLRERFIERVQDHIERLEGGGAPDRGQTGLPGGISIDQITSAGVDEAVRNIVPNTSRREDFHTGEEFTADPEMERSFMRLVFDVEGDKGPFSRSFFKTAPDRRRNSMRAWVRGNFLAGNVSRSDLEKRGLPTEWIEDL